MRCYNIITSSQVGSDPDLLGTLVVADTRHVWDVGSHRLHLVHEGIAHCSIVLKEYVENKQTLYPMILVYNRVGFKYIFVSEYQNWVYSY